MLQRTQRCQEQASAKSDAHDILKWHYSACNPATDPALFGPFQSFMELWISRRPGTGALPSRSEFDFFDFQEWWGRISIAKVERNPLNVRFVLWGTRLTEWWGVDYTNREVGAQSTTPEVWKQVEWRYFERMCKSPFVGLAYGPLDQHGRETINVMGLDLPLVKDGLVRHVLSVHILIGPHDTPETIMPECPFEPITAQLSDQGM